MPKKEYEATDIQPVVSYGHDGSDPVRIKTDSSGNVHTVPGSIVPVDYDYTAITYDANQNPLTIVYKTGGAGGTTVMTVTMTYDVNQNLETRTVS